MMMGNDGGMFFGGGLMWLFWILIIVVIIVVIKAVLGNSPRGTATKGDSPLEILQKRYARGEINEEEFKRRRKPPADLVTQAQAGLDIGQARADAQFRKRWQADQADQADVQNGSRILEAARHAVTL